MNTLCEKQNFRNKDEFVKNDLDYLDFELKKLFFIHIFDKKKHLFRWGNRFFLHFYYKILKWIINYLQFTNGNFKTQNADSFLYIQYKIKNLFYKIEIFLNR